MHTYESLKHDIINLGIRPTDVIKIHSSLKQIGPIEGGGDTLLDVFCDYLGEEGLLVLPTHTWGNIQDYDYIFDPETVPTCLGVLPNLFRVRKNVYRSLHPLHSVCAFGKNAQEFVVDPPTHTTYCPRTGCYGKLMDLGGKILLLGVGLNKNTFFHAIEEWNAGGLPHWYRKTPWPCRVKMPDGTIVDDPIFPTGVGTSERFPKALDVVLALKSTVQGKIGNADCLLIDCKDVYPAIIKLLQEQPNIFLEP